MTAPWGALPAPLKREPLALSDAELAAALRERIGEFNELLAMAHARGINVQLVPVMAFAGAPKIGVQIAKVVQL